MYVVRSQRVNNFFIKCGKSLRNASYFGMFLGKHLVLVTDPEIVEEAYAFDNPCFKDVTASSANRLRDGAVSVASGDTPGKDSVRWSTSWTTLGLGSTNRNDKRKTLDDSCLGVSAFSSMFSLRVYSRMQLFIYHLQLQYFGKHRSL